MIYFAKASVCAAVILAVAVAGVPRAAVAQANTQVLKDREALMKRQGKSYGAVKAYLDGKGDQAAAEAGVTDLTTQTLPKIPDVFPAGSAGTSPDGKYAAKPAIWTEWDKFLAARKNAEAKAEVLLAAIKSGDKPKIQAALVDLGKNGCGGCHENFRETLKK